MISIGTSDKIRTQEEVCEELYKAVMQGGETGGHAIDIGTILPLLIQYIQATNLLGASKRRIVLDTLKKFDFVDDHFLDIAEKSIDIIVMMYKLNLKKKKTKKKFLFC